MEILIQNKDLKAALAVVAPAINPGNIMPILRNVEFLFDDGFELFSTDLQTSIRTFVDPATVNGEAFNFSVDFQLLNNLLKNLPSEDLKLVVGDALEVYSSKGEFSFPVFKEALPQPPVLANTNKLEVKGFVLDMILKATLTSVNNDDIRPVMNGVLFDIKEEGSVFVSTNAFKLNRYKTKISGVPSKVIVPPVVAKNVLGLQDEIVYVEYNDVNISFEYGKAKVTGRLIDGIYPDYTRVVPEDYTDYLLVDSGEFAAAVKRAALFSPQDSQEVIFNTAQSTIYGSNINFSTSSANHIESELHGAGVEIKFNATYLLDVLKVAGEGRIKISYSTPEKQVLFNNPASPGLTGLVMPIR